MIYSIRIVFRNHCDQNQYSRLFIQSEEEIFEAESIIIVTCNVYACNPEETISLNSSTVGLTLI